MDPLACFRRMVESMRDNDPEETKCAAEDLYNWLRGDGFVPQLDRQDFMRLLVQIELTARFQLGETIRPVCRNAGPFGWDKV